MAYSVNTTPLLQECDSESEETHIPEDEIVIRDAKPLFQPLEPRDKYYLTYLIFYLLGIVTLLPWNFFVTADDYWMYKFRDLSQNVTRLNGDVKRTPLQAEFTSYISVASAVPSLIFLALNSAVSHRVSLNKRILGSLISMLILFTLTLAFVVTNTDKWQQVFFFLTLITVVLLNVCSAILSGSLFGIMGKFSPLYITATLGGQALGGVFAAITQIASLSIGASSTHSALVYFSIGNITILFSAMAYIIMTKTVYFKYHVFESRGSLTEFHHETNSDILSHKEICKKIWCYGLSMFMVFGITITVYPGVTVLVESEGRGPGHVWNNVFFVPTINYLLFNIGDYVGRIIAGRIQKPKSGSVLLILSLGRFIFIPLLMLCNAQPRHNMAVVFEKDYEFILMIFLCAFSNGYLANVSAIHLPRAVNHHEKEVASALGTVFMGVGLALGSGLCLLMVKIL